MKLLLSFAIGAILGDIFFHLIPESLQSYVSEMGDSDEVAQQKVGLAVIAGIFMFIIVEMVLEKWSSTVELDAYNMKSDLIKSSQECTIDYTRPLLSADQITIFRSQDLNRVFGSVTHPRTMKELNENNNGLMANLNHVRSDFTSNNKNIHRKLNLIPFDSQGVHDESRITKCDRISRNGYMSLKKDTFDSNIKPKVNDVTSDCQTIDAAGYLNLIANGFDNFTHGLAIGASFLVGPKVGLLTTFVIFIHEIPHEICDYAILVNSGFSRWDAVKAQSSVSLFGILGTAIALSVKSVQSLNAKTVWILPFSAGGFLYIALVNLLPEVLERDSNARSSLGQIAGVILGIAFMAAVAVI